MMDKLIIDKDTVFQNSLHEQITLDEAITKIEKFCDASPDSEYRLSIGTDSMTYDDTFFVLAIVLHRVGNGGIFFYKKMKHPKVNSLREKLYAETQLSLDATEILIERLLEENEALYDKLQLSIHLDIGENGPTKALIRELEGWVKAMGYDYAIKPESYAASTIANIYSK